jgi:hypothetical protein
MHCAPTDNLLEKAIALSDQNRSKGDRLAVEEVRIWFRGLTSMTLKEELIQELQQVPESELVKVLEFLRSLKVNTVDSGDPDVLSSEGDRSVWNAYLESEQEREEVYRRLASS